MKNTTKEKFISYYRNEHMKKILYSLAEMNDIFIGNNKDLIGAYSFLSNTAIVNGNLHIDTQFYENVIHELCHILVVEPELRHHMIKDTEMSYKYLNSKYPENKISRRETTTIALQDRIYKEYNLYATIRSDFFDGIIGKGSDDVNKEWRDRLDKIDYVNYKGIDIGNLYIPHVFSSFEKEPDQDCEIMILKNGEVNLDDYYNVKISCEQFVKATYKKGYYHLKSLSEKLMTSEVKYWCYDR